MRGEGSERTVAVLPTGKVHRVGDYEGGGWREGCSGEEEGGRVPPCPLELCARIVQEDLILMRPQSEEEAEEEDAGSHASGSGGDLLSGPAASSSKHVGATSGAPRPSSYVLAAAAVVFSFVGLPEKLSRPLVAIHAPVPGYEADLQALVDRTFRGMRAGCAPLWRNNWWGAGSTCVKGERRRRGWGRCVWEGGREGEREKGLMWAAGGRW